MSDGTSSGTKILKDIRGGLPGSYPSFMTVMTPEIGSEGLYFFAHDGEMSTFPRQDAGYGGVQLWVTYGTPITTKRAFEHTYNEIEIDRDALDAAWKPYMGLFQQSLYYPGRKDTRSMILPDGGLTGENDYLIKGFDQAFVIKDVDSYYTMDKLQMILTCSKGSLRLGYTAGLDLINGDFEGDRHLSMEASLDTLNIALRDLHYTASPGEVGWDEVTISVTDRPSTCGGSDVNTSTCDYGIGYTVETKTAIHITAVNDPPEITAPLEAQVTVDEFLEFSEVPITIFDPDANQTAYYDAFGTLIEGYLSVSVSCLYGRLSLAGQTGLSFSVGEGINDPRIDFQGVSKHVNEALHGMKYKCWSTDANCVTIGSDVITVFVSDNGFTGSGGALSASIDITINLISNETE